MRRQIVFNTPVGREITEANTISCVERHDTMLSVVDGQLVSQRRPGLVEFADLGTASSVKGLFYWREKNILLAVSNTTLYKVSSAGTVTSIGVITGANRAIFAEFRTPSNQVLLATGSNMYVTDGSTVSAITDGDAPTSVAYVRSFQKYALAQEVGAEQVHYSDALTFDPEDWAGDFFSAQGAPDDLQAIGVSFDEILLLGRDSLERYYNDGNTPFSRISGGAISYGTEAPYSLVFANNSWFYLTHERDFIQLTGSQPQIISGAVDATIRGFNTVSDAFCLHDTQRKLILVCFPTEDKTLVYDYAVKGWIGEWNYWNTGTSAYERFRGNALEYISEWKKSVVGDKSNGKLYYMDESNYQDDGGIMRSSFVSANLIPNQGEWVRNSKLDLWMKRGYGNDDPVFKLRYRQNGSQTYGNIKDGSIGNTGDNKYRERFTQLGRYQSRQYEFYCTDNAPFTLINAFEEVV